MQILVHIQEEISFSTIDNDSQIAILYLINLIDNGMIIPYFLVRFTLIPQHYSLTLFISA